jgi:peptide/nickel transport system substrate-binding protein
MANTPYEQLARDFREGRIDRRDLFKRASAIGLSAAGLGMLLATGQIPAALAAQEASPSAGGTVSDQLLTASDEQTSTWTRNFNPLLPQGSSNRWPTINGIYEPLFIYTRIKAESVPWLATKWAFNDDNTVITFTTREGVSWSDGEPFSAKDVAYTFNLFLENDAIPGNGGQVVAPFLSKVEATDDKTVVFTFKEPYTIGLYDIGGQMIVPEHIFSKEDDLVTFTNENPVGTGPFTNVARFEAQVWELHRNDNYWQEGKPYFQGFQIPAYPSNDAINLATINGENDWAANFIPDIEKTYIAEDPDHFHYWFPSTGDDVMLYLNTTVAPFDNVDVRKAISMAINRDQIVQIAMYDYTHPADTTGLSDAYEAAKDKDAASAGWTEYDVDKANEMLDAAGLKKDGDTRKTADGKAMEYELNVVSGWSDWVQSCEIMAQNLKDIGIKVTVKPYEQATWQTNVQNGDFTMSIGWSSGGATVYNFYRGAMSSTTWHEIGESSAENWHRFKSEEVDKLLADFASTSDPDEQRAIGVEMQKLFADNAPCIPLFPGPQWGEYNTTRFEGFPDKDNPYALLSTYSAERLLVMTTLTATSGS